jgi:hypothetical protein
MATTFIPGYFAELSLGAVAIEHVAGSGTLTLNKNVILKPVAGAQAPLALATLRSGSIAYAGHVTIEDLGKLQTAYDSDAELAYIWAVGEAGGATDAGEYTGNLIVESFELSWDAEDEWAFTMSCVLSGDAVYAAPA